MTEASRYVLVLYVTERRGSPPVPPGEVAEAIGRSPAATTEMLQRLDDRGLVTYEPYEGATLTDEGRETAEELYETYGTLSRFFRDVLGLEDYREEAIQLTGTISPTVADRLASILPSEDGDEFAEGSASAVPPAEGFELPGTERENTWHGSDRA
ncbi:metal-dependent transcriptional regulator [Salinirubellus sp. GCM10025818]|uniref:metal-dependent transcriptional regulator n=1 Tax=Salinirubellus TaxID=2162630 RepID=UPI0030CE006F